MSTTRQATFSVAAGPVFRDIGRTTSNATPDRHAQRLAAELRRQAEMAMEVCLHCQPSSLPAHLDRLRTVRTLCELSLPLLPEAQQLRSDRQLCHPLTVVDYVAAMSHFLGHHRPPPWLHPGRELLEEISHKLDAVEDAFHSLQDGGDR
jgi:hypothetical protein